LHAHLHGLVTTIHEISGLDLERFEVVLLNKVHPKTTLLPLVEDPAGIWRGRGGVKVGVIK
jgi:hypothetical protein